MTDAEKILKSYRSAVEDIASRAGDTISGGAKNSLSSDVNSAASVYNLTQGARDSMTNDYISDCAYSLNRAKSDLAQLKAMGADTRDIRSQQNIVDDWQRKYNAAIISENAQRRATQAAYGLADDIRSSAAKDIARAKDGLGYAGQTAVDVGAALTEMGLDSAKTWYLNNRFNVNPALEDYVKLAPLAGRKYGENTQKARLDGAGVGKASIYGAATAITDTTIEKAFDGLNGIYGKSATDKFAGIFKSELKDGSLRNKLAKASFDDAGEGFESIATDIANQLLKSVYNGNDSLENWYETEWGRVGHNMLVNTIVGILSGDVAF